MSQELRTRPRITLLNTDGKRHPLENTLAVGTFVFGMIAVVTGMIPSAHLVAVIAGLVGFIGGLYSQLISATTGERWLNVLGIGTSFVGLGLGMANGGLSL
jgi:hypothetical protein